VYPAEFGPANNDFKYPKNQYFPFKNDCENDKKKVVGFSKTVILFSYSLDRIYWIYWIFSSFSSCPLSRAQARRAGTKMMEDNLPLGKRDYGGLLY